MISDAFFLCSQVQTFIFHISQLIASRTPMRKLKYLQMSTTVRIAEPYSRRVGTTARNSNQFHVHLRANARDSAGRLILDGSRMQAWCFAPPTFPSCSSAAAAALLAVARSSHSNSACSSASPCREIDQRLQVRCGVEKAAVASFHFSLFYFLFFFTSPAVVLIYSPPTTSLSTTETWIYENNIFTCTKCKILSTSRVINFLLLIMSETRARERHFLLIALGSDAAHTSARVNLATA